MRIQPPWIACRERVEEAFDHAEVLVWLEQLCPQLASAGMLTLGRGQPHRLTGK